VAVRLRVPEVLRRYSGGAAEVAVTGATVRAALEGLFALHPDLRERVLDPEGEVFPYLLLFCNRAELPRDGLLECPLEDGDLLEIVVAAAGG
jgi:hypothetical protein